MALVEDTGVKVVVDLTEETLESGETTTKGTRLELEVDFRGSEGTGFGLENITGEILFVFDLEGDDATLARNGTSSLDFVGLVYKSQSAGFSRAYGEVGKLTSTV